MEYKNTIITPQTSFPMKAGLPAREPNMLKSWEERSVQIAKRKAFVSLNKRQRRK